MANVEIRMWNVESANGKSRKSECARHYALALFHSTFALRNSYFSSFDIRNLHFDILAFIVATHERSL
jgi:hypothetical protein